MIQPIFSSANGFFDNKKWSKLVNRIREINELLLL